LCDAYWTPATQAKLQQSNDLHSLSDVEIEIVRKHGPLSWDAIIIASRSHAPGQSALLRTARPFEFVIGSKLRVIDAAIATEKENGEQPVIISAVAFSELYTVVPRK
jgi:hypothetical protein